ncbi:MAG TPA: NAD(P)(+) transhydrogenase (Re/Si-specific) subunit beta [Candidatus Limnocylindrales bacterium]|jgi:H+-translocating NAD(P) transhydrogenase subunit beta|nr:NAD(P)(+) transhydrogenase (Re/Si-specific) subunit beta [Candidatus Limnocylindrales bacterium]
MEPIELLTYFVWLVASISFILALKFLASPQTARRGNQLGAAGMALVIAWTFFTVDGMLENWWIIVVGGAIGAVAGYLGAKRVAMTAMPQMVAIFNGAGGGAAAVVAVAEFLEFADHGEGLLALPFVIAVLAGAIIGSVALTGSIIAFGKLQGIVTPRPYQLPGQRIITGVLFLAMLGLAVYIAAVENSIPLFLIFTVLALITGVVLVMPIGGADMPVVVSLLNSYTGIAVAASGFVLSNYALLIAGTLVGASGAILTQLMTKAMNRSLFNVLFAGFGTGGDTSSGGEEGEEQLKETTAEDAAVLMAYGKRVIIVPGYGMAVAQAQGPVRELMDLLVAKGVDVQFAIHPVAGRMPGHMNVLLAEANVPYDRLKEMDEINEDFADTDVALVIGANDVVNPVAREAGSPISGMPILDVDQAQHVIVLKRGRGAGFAGIPNPLFSMERTSMLFGNAKETVESLVQGVKTA